jgi:hypothetical protein
MVPKKLLLEERRTRGRITDITFPHVHGALFLWLNLGGPLKLNKPSPT